MKNEKFMKFQNYHQSESEKIGQTFLSSLQLTLRVLLHLSLLPVTLSPETAGTHTSPMLSCLILATTAYLQLCTGRVGGLSWICSTQPWCQYKTRGKKQSSNFLAKYINGNRNKGILNMHLNIRSLKNKVSEIKNIIKQHNPHILGLSECELKKKNNQFDENVLKIPGYNIIYPKSWNLVGQARVIVYVKKSLDYVQVQDLEDPAVQSVWIKGGFKKGKKIYFCHGYREHTTLAGITQQENLEKFLNQWEDATSHNNPSEPNEVHVSGDMNLDCLDDRWLRNDYPLVSLSRLVNSCCNVNNFSQLVQEVTRVQYNSVRNTTDISCLDHVYSNAKHRCSKVTVTSFGSSDHDMLGYVRYSKEPAAPARTIRKRSYKKFDSTKYLDDMSQVDWSPVLSCPDLDLATEIFTFRLKSVLDVHAPWIKFQQRKYFSPWLTDETKLLIKEREVLKEKAKELAIRDSNSITVTDEQKKAWEDFKKVRNNINNIKKNEEHNFKKNKISENLDNPTATWSTAKSFMGWKSTGTPHQLEVNNVLETKPSRIAKIMNDFFINKIKTIRNNMFSVQENFVGCLKMMVGKKCSLSLNHVTKDDVKKLLKKLKNTKSTSVDELDNFSVKLAAEYIAEPLHHIVTLSLMQNKFPTNWKYTKVIPLHKKLSQLDPKN